MMTPKEFTLALAEVMQRKKLDKKRVARVTGASHVTVQRWLFGVNTPWPSLFKPILDALEEL